MRVRLSHVVAAAAIVLLWVDHGVAVERRARRAWRRVRR